MLTTAGNTPSFAATNIVLRIANEETGEEAALGVFPAVVNMMVLALGNQAVSYHPKYGMTFGEEPLKGSFGDDLGLTICWSCLNLKVDGTEEANEREEAKEVEEEK